MTLPTFLWAMRRSNLLQEPKVLQVVVLPCFNACETLCLVEGVDQGGKMFSCLDPCPPIKFCMCSPYRRCQVRQQFQLCLHPNPHNLTAPRKKPKSVPQVPIAFAAKTCLTRATGTAANAERSTLFRIGMPQKRETLHNGHFICSKSMYFIFGVFSYSLLLFNHWDRLVR